MSKDKLAASIVVRHAQKHNHDDDDACASPVNANLVDQVEVFCAEDIDTHTYEHDSPEA